VVRLLRGLLGALLWILASLVGLLGVVACVTLILLPVGIPLLMLARRLFGKSFRLFMPPAIANPVKETRSRGQKRKEAAGKLGKQARRKMADKTQSVGPVGKQVKQKAKGAQKKTRKFLTRKRKLLK
jgi:hypothetical protein